MRYSYSVATRQERMAAVQHDLPIITLVQCNPPRHVARLFHEVMDEPEFKNRYRPIVFAILDDHNTHHKHNPEGNFKPFVEEFTISL